MDDRRCRGCKEIKLLDQFHLSRHKTRETLCKTCKQAAQTRSRRDNREDHNAKQNARIRANPEQRRKWMLKTKYGLSMEQYQEMWENQEGRCPSCGDALKETRNGAHVDHCHVSGKVRGILCGHCNVALGYLKDDPNRIMGLHDYMLEFSND